MIVLIDRDGDDCAQLKERLEKEARSARLVTRATSPTEWVVATRIAARELENWYFGDWTAVRRSFSQVAERPPASYRNNPDCAAKKTSEAFVGVLRDAGIRLESKPTWAKRIAPHLEPERNTSPSFRAFWKAVEELADP
ncbi:protein of unknown function (DUF4276) [Streptoalloteichus tenebrarius]|uniref:Uncharacterized protein n=1 Tax=Streptoalloteichus tenebrarius (strain ATCC 17920 / DSM 40477 / JCM 4838 / CBS 697.72 / NBRC 16177 / NCIMB 11028 / NRRL B-12390 / A12253. 1 / ISP 5477) TaxID=1933 RepID=A0ABT1HSE9_STRSD|nr:protein of unknown function (DUF4276) [Streptoalloteichus tenebrarius]